LHGRSFSEVSKYRNCGRKTLNELREFVRRIQGAHYSETKNLQTGVVPEQEPGPVVAARFFVPAELQHLKISHLPISVRLEGVLRQMKVRELGQLHGISVEEFKAIRNCGRKTIQEVGALLVRAINGEFSISAVALQKLILSDLLSLIDSLIEKLRPRDKEWLLSRLGTKGSIPTLEEVGRKAGVTRERVRQVVEKALDFIRKMGPKAKPPSSENCR
jgi:RNA polymerase alpha subunit/sigma-70-like protein